MNKQLNSSKELQAYIIGLSLGDGNLSKSGRATRLRITCDKKYPFLYKKILSSLESLLPDNKVSIVNRAATYLNVSVYSNYLEELLGWKAKGGSKFLQKACVPSWIKENNIYQINCLRGLIETDGSIYTDRGYKMVIFKSISFQLTQDFYNMMIDLGFNPHQYKITPRNSIYNTQIAYHVRLSKNVNEFLELVKPEKI